MGSGRVSGSKAGACALMAALLLGGACDRNKPGVEPYFGVTLPVDQLIAQINTRNASIDTLRCEGTFSADLIDPKTRKKTAGSGDSVLMYMPQRNLRLVGRVLGQPAFEIGSNADRYWLFVGGDTNTLYWGNHRLIGGRSAGVLPVRPDLLPEVLAVGAIDSDLLKEPFPVLRFNNDQDCYMLTWQVLLSDRWVVQKEVWYDRQTLLPKLVLLFDGNGRIVLRAYLKKHAPVEGYDPSLQIATEYAMYFPESGSTFDVRLTGLKRTSGRIAVPSIRSFNFPGDSMGDAKVIQIDE